MKQKQWQKIFYVIANSNLIVQYLIQIKNGIIKYVNSEKIIVVILAHEFVSIASI